MGAIAAPKVLGNLSTPVVFEVGEGPDPGPVADVVNRDTPAPVETGIAPLKAVAIAVSAIVGGYLILRKLLE